MPEPEAVEVSKQGARSGPHRVLLAFYAIFVLAAGARSAVQLATAADRAPVAYSLSAVAACAYAAGWVAIRRASVGKTGFASVMLWVELFGVVSVGTLSLVRPELFPDASVWSEYGIGYGFVPAVLPLAGLYWLHRQKLAFAREGARGRHDAGRRPDRHHHRDPESR